MADRRGLGEQLREIRRRAAADRRLIAALGAYLVLAIVARATLGGFLRGGVLALLAILAVKTLIHALQAVDD